MSHKHYQYKLLEAADTAEFETLLKTAGSQRWSAVGYGVLPDGRRSALMQRKVKIHSRSHRHTDDDRQRPQAARVVAHDD
jgi:hypothetical protein